MCPQVGPEGGYPMTKYAQHVSTRETPQSEQASPAQRENSAGGYSFTLDCWGRLDRWLILGAEGGTYYASEQKLTKDNAKTIFECLKTDGLRTVARIVEVSDAGRAPKNDPAIFALAIAAADDNKETRAAALAALPKVARIGTHLFHFVASVEQFRGWGRALRNAIAKWYLDKPADKLAFQVVKYQQRDKWSHRDVLRLCHGGLQNVSPSHDAIFRWIVSGDEGLAERDVKRRTGKPGQSATSERVIHYNAIQADAMPKLISGYKQLKAEKDSKVVAKLIAEYGFTHEMIPTEHKNSIEVWEALLEHMPMTAMVRNLGKMTKIGLLKPLSAASKKVVVALSEESALKKARVHPIALLSALKVYQQGHGERGSLTWEADGSIVDALDRAFYLAFSAIEPTGKNVLLALDVSGSMESGEIAGVPGLTPRVASAAMAMVTAKTEKNWAVVGFTSPGFRNHVFGGMWGGDTALTKLNISPRQRLDDVLKVVSGLPFGGTDCSLPMTYALENKLEVDAFYIYTDSETWAGKIHPHQALTRYRQAMGRDAKLVVVGMTATEFTIADPSDAGMLDVVGFDTAAPALMADFTRR